MPIETKPQEAGVTAASIDAALPRGYFVKRGAIMAAFRLSRREWDALVPEVFIPIPGAKFKYQRFSRPQVVEVARRWERTGRPAA